MKASPSGLPSSPVVASTLAITQSDGISSTSQLSVTTNSNITNLNSVLQQANQQIGQLNGQVSNLTSRLDSTMQQLNTYTNVSYGIAIVAVVGVAMALMSLRRRQAAAP